MIHFIIPGDPVAQGRPRASIRGGKINMRDPDKSRNYKAFVKTAALPYRPKEPVTEAIQLEIHFYKAIPPSWTKKKKEAARDGRLKPMVKPDIDNYCKSVMDALSGLIYEDDKQICDLFTKKRYSDEPRTEVFIRIIPIHEGEQR